MAIYTPRVFAPTGTRIRASHEKMTVTVDGEVQKRPPRFFSK